MNKRIIVLILIGVLLLVVPMLAAGEIIYNGRDEWRLGDITWTIDDEGLLNISGTGSMRNTQNSTYEWKRYKSYIKTVIIEEGITTIGEYAFQACSNMTSIVISDSVKNINSYAFSGCSSLIDIVIPNSVTNIGFDAFWGCRSLKSIIIPDSVKAVDGFKECTSLTSITLPNSITRINGYAFYGCDSLTSIIIPESVLSIGNYAFANCGNLNNIILPDGVTSIGPYAFSDCGNLSNIHLSKNLLSIGSFAFRNCNSLTSIIIPDSVTSIGTYAFYCCSGLTSVNIPDGVMSIEEGVFDVCSSLTSITIPDGVVRIGVYAFNGCCDLNSINIPEGVTVIGFGAFQSCSKLNEITLPDRLEFIGGSAFNGCSSLTSIFIPDGVTTINEDAFYHCSAIKYASVGSDGAKALSKYYSFRPPQTKYNLQYLYSNDSIIGMAISSADADIVSCVIPDYVTNIASSAFRGCSGLTGVEIPSSVTDIGQYAFAGCGKLATIEIPNSVMSIGQNAFEGCSSLTSIVIPDGIRSIEKNTFQRCSSLTGITIPDGLVSVGESAFEDCNSLICITLADSVSDIGARAFYGCSSLDCITIPDGVTSLNISTFRNCNNLSKIAIPDSVHTFGNYLFSTSPTVFCNEYSDAYYWAADAGYSIACFDNSNIDDIRTVILPDNLRLPVGMTTSIASTVFPLVDEPDYEWRSSAPSIVSVNNGVLTAHSTGIATITLTVGSVSESVNVNVFQRASSYQISCTDLWLIAQDMIQLSITDLEPMGAEVNITWGSSDLSCATVDSTGLVKTKKPADNAIIISADSETGIHKECLLHICYPVTGIHFSDSETTIIPYVVYQSEANVTMRTQQCVNHLIAFSSSNPEIATVDEYGVVRGIKEGTVSILATSASGETASMTIHVRTANTLQLPEGLTEIANEAFMDTACEAVIIPEGCTTIGEYAFAGCADLVYVRIPESVESYPNSAFYNCNSKLIIDWARE